MYVRVDPLDHHRVVTEPGCEDVDGVTLHRGGDRQANAALWRIALTRMSSDPDTRAYVARRTNEGLSQREVMRCLKCYIAREPWSEASSQTPQSAAT